MNVKQADDLITTYGRELMSGNVVASYAAYKTLMNILLKNESDKQEAVAEVGPRIYDGMANPIRWTDMQAMDRLPIGTKLYTAPPAQSAPRDDDWMEQFHKAAMDYRSALSGPDSVSAFKALVAIAKETAK